MTDRISTDELRKLLADATPGRRDVSKIGTVHIRGRMLPEQVDEARQEGESWLDMRKRKQSDFDSRQRECDANANLHSLSYDLAAEVIELREALTAVSREYDPSDGCNNAMTMHDIARAALNHKETGEEMRTCHHCKKQTAKRQLSCTWCGIWEKG